ncbi:MAG: pyridoxal phosphate-dependent aminotransferase [Deltaproteobacteria bacterium]|nr:pyridoxal phosphate-dependent aminotransferase [Deltaproteobacteria bacterium]
MVSCGVASRRSGFPRGENALTQALAARRAAGGAIIDLTESNPTRVGLEDPAAALAAAMWDARSLVYAPDPVGLPAARAAVAADLARRGHPVDPDRIVLTASTSDAYGLLFKLLCDPGDDLLVPRPSYPLFDYLATLEGVHVAHYPLLYAAGWQLDVDAVRAAIGPRTRALVVVSPNNPTGSRISEDERRALVGLARDHELALIADEVFADYDLPGGRPGPDLLAAHDDVLTFSLGGLSKGAGLPQLKLGWIICAGPAAARAEAQARLALIADSYLAVATPVQHAAPALLALAPALRDAIRARTQGNRAWLARACAGTACTLLAADGGWSAVLRVPVDGPAGTTEERLALELVQDGVLVHPGYFFDFASEAFLVVSLLPAPGDFQAGTARVLARCAPPS